MTENTMKSIAQDNTHRIYRILKQLLRLEAHMLGNSSAVPKVIETDSLYLNVRETNLLLGTTEVALGRVVDLCGYDTGKEPGTPVAHEVRIDIGELLDNRGECPACQKEEEDEQEVEQVHTPRAKRPSEIKAAAARKAAKKATRK